MKQEKSNKAVMKRLEQEEQAIRKARADYMRQWYQKNKKKSKDRHRIYWLKRAIAQGLIQQDQTVSLQNQ